MKGKSQEIKCQNVKDVFRSGHQESHTYQCEIMCKKESQWSTSSPKWPINHWGNRWTQHLRLLTSRVLSDLVIATLVKVVEFIFVVKRSIFLWATLKYSVWPEYYFLQGDSECYPELLCYLLDIRLTVYCHCLTGVSVFILKQSKETQRICHRGIAINNQIYVYKTRHLSFLTFLIRQSVLNILPIFMSIFNLHI